MDTEIWQTVLRRAEEVGDRETAELARNRLYEAWEKITRSE